MTISLSLTDVQGKQLLQLLDLAIGAAPIGQRLQVADVALPIAAKVETALVAKPSPPSAPPDGKLLEPQDST